MKKRFSNAIKITVLFTLSLIQALYVIPYVSAQESEGASAAYSTPSEALSTDTAAEKSLLDLNHQKDTDNVYLQAENLTGEENGGAYSNVDADSNEGTSGGVLALWIDGERVVQTPQQVAEWERGLYACKTKEEYTAYLENVAYYNKGIDMSRFEWTWDELREIYTDEQIELLKKDSNVKKRMPNAIGMSAQQAYRMFTDAGFIVRLSYQYSPNTDVPAGYCYEQEIPAGQLWRMGSSFFIWIQVAKAEVKLTVPDVVGRPEADVRHWLSYLGFANVDYQYEYSDSWDAGYCVGQSIASGTVVGVDDYIRIVISLGPLPAPPSEEPAPTEPIPEPAETPTEPAVTPEPTPTPAEPTPLP